MGQRVDQLYVQFSAQTRQFTTALQDLNRRTTRFENQQRSFFRRNEQGWRSLGRSIARVAASVGTAYLAIRTVSSAFRTIVTNTARQETAVRLLNNAIQTTGRSTVGLSRKLQEYASQRQRVTTFGDEQTISLAQQAVRFTAIADEQLTRFLTLIQDVASFSGRSPERALRTLGVALQDPVAGLTRLEQTGISFTSSQKALIRSLVESGQQVRAQSLLFEALEGTVGGAAVAVGETLTGSLAQLSNAFGDAFEQGGALGGFQRGLRQLQTLVESEAFSSAISAAAVGLSYLVEKSSLAVISLGAIFSEDIRNALLLDNLEKLNSREAVERLLSAAGLTDETIRGLRTHIEERLERGIPQDLASRGLSLAETVAFTLANDRPVVRRRYNRDDNSSQNVFLSQADANIIEDFIVQTVAERREAKESASGGSFPVLEVPVPVEIVIQPESIMLSEDRERLMEELRLELVNEFERLSEAFDSFGSMSSVGIDVLIEQMDEFIKSVETGGDAITVTIAKMANSIEQARARLDELREESQQLGEVWGDIGRSADEAFLDIITGAGSARDVLRALFRDISRTLLRSAFGGEGFFSALFSGFSGGGARAEGGPVAPGERYLVGERGPELFVPRQAGQIIPNGDYNQYPQSNQMTIAVSVQSGVSEAVVVEAVQAGLREVPGIIAQEIQSGGSFSNLVRTA